MPAAVSRISIGPDTRSGPTFLRSRIHHVGLRLLSRQSSAGATADAGSRVEILDRHGDPAFVPHWRDYGGQAKRRPYRAILDRPGHEVLPYTREVEAQRFELP